MGFTFSTMALNLLLLMAMVATNILSLYHLSSTLQSPKSPKAPPPVPDQLIRQLHTIRATINHLTRLHKPDQKSTIPPDLLLYSQLAPIPSACHNHPDLLHTYMTYTPFSLCPSDTHIAESLILRGCHPLPRRRCFSRTPPKIPTLPTHPFPSSLPDSAVIWDHYKCKSFHCLNNQNPNPNLAAFQPSRDAAKFNSYSSALDLPVPQLFQIAAAAGSVLRLGLDPLQQRLPVFDGVVDLVRCGRAVNRWIPLTVLEFLVMDVDRVLRGGGYLWVDHFFSKGLDLEKVYGPLFGKLGYKKVKWATGNKTDSGGLKNGELYLTALLQKPLSR
ncbi:uncharacterized protein LOC109813205 [Cajanus cajan]|uniref:uncharacterized protein LOC109813205 n=1 Tax=Cajanus cajan TaxID=3821 RepID=UPI00098DB2BC|nr:uncharacterized protein LOC109813205 [Cajanus cajan]